MKPRDRSNPRPRTSGTHPPQAGDVPLPGFATPGFLIIGFLLPRLQDIPLVPDLPSEQPNPGDVLPEGYGGLSRASDVFRPEFFDSSRLFDFRWLLLVALLVLLAGVALWLYRLHRRKVLTTGPMGLFHRTANELGLGLTEQWLLYRVATQQGLPTPLTLLLSPATLRRHGYAYASQLPLHKREDFLAHFERLATKIFGSTSET